MGHRFLRGPSATARSYPFIAAFSSHEGAPSRRTRRLIAGGLAASAALAAHLAGARPALAYDTLAEPCKVDPHFCQTAPLQFERHDALPIEWSFDTGWVPQGSPLQVHIWAGVFASTRLSLAGSLDTSWPEAFTLKTPGAPDGGKFGLHYGVDIGAQGKVEIEIAGKTYSWTGDLPYIPQFDFQVQADGTFDAWGYPPGVSISAKTEQQKLAKIGLGDIIGGSIPGLDGGFELDVAMELQATYVTERVVIETTDGEPVSGGPITSDKGESAAKYLGGPSIELDVRPEGTVDYDGVLHLIPAFYVELLGKSFSIPIADIPVAFPITKTDAIFDAQRAHIPLPDLVLPEEEIDFGEVEVGQKNLEGYGIFNAGEADLHVSIVSSDPEAFEVFDAILAVDPSATADSAIRFVPKKNGEVKATIYIASNDPSDPVQELHVRGVGYGGLEEAEPTAPVDAEQPTGCACRAAGEPGPAPAREGAAVSVAALMAGAVFARRRKRAAR